MGFFLQLRILLWKNLTLKRRTPLVLLFELFIPLVLFVILLCIRHKQPAYPMPDSHLPTKPLPSAGILAVMQEFCAGGDRDSLNFRNFPGSTVHQFLTDFQSVAENNNFFDPGFRPSEMDNIPDLYHRIIDDPALLHSKIVKVQSLQLNSMLGNVSQLVTELAQNYSLPVSATSHILSSTINVTEVYRLLLGEAAWTNDGASRRSRHRRSPTAGKRRNPIDASLLSVVPNLQLDQLKLPLPDAGRRLADALTGNDDIRNKLLSEAFGSISPSLGFLPDKGLLAQLLADNPQLLLDPEFRRTMMEMATALSRSEMASYLAGHDPAEFVHLIKKIHVSPSLLHSALCTNNELSRILIPYNESFAGDIRYVSWSLCNMSDSQWSRLVHAVSQHLALESVADKLDLQGINASVLASRVQHFEDNLDKFLLFQQNLLFLSQFASTLPQNLCTEKYQHVFPSPAASVSSDAVTAPNNATDSTVATNGKRVKRNAFHDTTIATTESSTVNMNDDPEDRGYRDGSGDQLSPENSRNAGLMRIWVAMQNTLCGFSTVDESSVDNLPRDIRIDDLGLTQDQMKDIGMLVHALYSNPKVLYAPNNTAANLIMNKVNRTFALVDVISEYAQKWLKVSVDIRTYLLLNSTEENIQEIIKMQQVLRGLPVLLRLMHSSSVRQFLLQPIDPSTVNRTVFLRQLDVVDNAACSWLSLVRGINVNVLQGFATEDDLVNYFLHDAYSDGVTVLASVIFENLDEDSVMPPPHVVYKIRQNATFTDNTKFVRDKYWHPGPGDTSDRYYHFGFVFLQDMVERAIIDVQVGRDVLEPGTFVHQMPHPCYMEDRFLFMIEHVMPLCLTISWVYTVAMLVQSIVYEKEHRLKEVMRMMGLNNSLHWLAWFLTTFGQMSVTMALLTIMLKYGGVLMYSNALITFIVLEVFAVATIWFSFLVSACYSKAKVASACAGIVYFLSYVPYMYIAIREEFAGDKISAALKSLASLLSTTAFGLGAKYFAFYEIEGVGVQWDNMSISPVEGDQYNLQLVLLMMVFDALLYGVLTWYIENVHPGSIGLPKPWYFPITKSYWCGGHGHLPDTEKHRFLFECWSKLSNCSRGLSVMEEDQACALDDAAADGSRCNFESEPSHLYCGVHVSRLTKVYKTGKLAINNLSFNLYEGQITSFLGHNGAGKTTTMSILTGLFPPSRGYATVYGLDIRTDMDEIRRSLGMCPQHNVLFDKLTVVEHLWLYARLKGMPASDIAAETDRMIIDLGLPTKRNTNVDCLSGGMKRKLSVAIAFIAGSRTVILDEPTAGVDPYARRAIWDLILKYKDGRTILLSTHHMDEADILGDRIAIISNGQLKCCGSSLFLKSTFGEGYHLVLVKKRSEEDIHSADDTLSLDEHRLPMHSRCSEEKLTAFICERIQSAYLKDETNHELHYILPFDEAKKGGFERLFNALDASLNDLHVTSYGIADTSLEEVFLKITADNLPKPDSTDVVDDNKLEPNSAKTTTSQFVVGPQTPVETDTTSLLSGCGAGGDAAGVEMNQFTSGSSVSSTLSSPSNNQRCEVDCDVPLLDSSNTAAVVDGDDVPLLVPEQNSPDGSSRRGKSKRDVGCRGGVLLGSALYFQQFCAILTKRFYYIRRNWKGLFSQILLPALFVCVAMTVALTAPQIQDLPPIVLSTSQYYNYTQPHGNFIPVSVTRRPGNWTNRWSKDAVAADVAGTFHLASGVAATCVLKSPFNSSFDADVLRAANFTSRSQQQLLLGKYFKAGCDSVFVKGLPMMNFVPPAPVVIQPSNKNDSVYYDGAAVPLMINNDYHQQQQQQQQPRKESKYHPDCTCTTDHTGELCTTNGFDIPPSYQTVTSEYIQDITGDDEEQYYLTTQDMYRLHRYGGYSFGLVRDSVPEAFGKKGPTQFRKLAVRHVALVWYDHKGYHSQPVFVNALNNAILRANLPAHKGNRAAYGITAINHPMNNTNTQLSMEYIKQGSDVLIAMFVICAMSFVPASFVVFLVYERSVKAKHLEIVSGLNRVVYWVSNYVWDMINYLIPGTCCILILKVFDIPAYVSSTNLPAVIMLFLLYGWSITPMMYPASFVFSEPSTAYIFLIVINLFIGITCIITSFLLELFQQNSPDLAHIHDVLKNIFLVFPNYCLGRGLMDVAFNEYRNEFYFKMGMYDEMKSPFEWKLTARNLVAMSIMGFIFFIITIFCEFSFFIKRRPKIINDSALPSVNDNDEDADVTQERRRVLRGSGRRDLLQLRNLSKVYVTRKLGRHQAVDRLCLGVPSGECFGLLGVNGAGKTTTFEMLTGDLQPTSGDATLDGYSITSDIRRVQQNIGYCPQFDALYDELTAREHLQLYSRLRGIPPNQQKQVVEWALERLSLVPYADKLSGTLSGGNKRKLSTAIALLGRPPVVFMDEPTTGMDPCSRRFLWNLILDLIREGTSVILTSHSMEECEILCTRLAVMVNGRLRCLGSAQHLKNKYGDGYTLLIRVRASSSDRDINAIKTFVSYNLPNARYKECHHNIIQYEFPSADLSLSSIFSTMERGCRDLPVDDYSVSQNTLDNVFINFVKQQQEIVQETTSERRATASDGINCPVETRTETVSSHDVFPTMTAAATNAAFQMEIAEEFITESNASSSSQPLLSSRVHVQFPTETDSCSLLERSVEDDELATSDWFSSGQVRLTFLNSDRPN